ncbi:hypothetical protein CPAR01_13226 [Colletotrichum paranaense]|uniref:Uncharacterized protein n=1 Tax=Colletotrichum paranaense TaxID=1914294 RepID=A0ABQ9S5F4_9PEZI|nr:uncharacterized protein CPAR01_13226 [Colletotrichum paranaense]KAK1526698.1 hypothetical protein CPAR01_13226 [Colletotrichum paranaense]
MPATAANGPRSMESESETQRRPSCSGPWNLPVAKGKKFKAPHVFFSFGPRRAASQNDTGFEGWGPNGRCETRPYHGSAETKSPAGRTDDGRAILCFV